MGEIKIDGFVCERCEHTWMSRVSTVGLPRVCPKCKSPYWNRPRKYGGEEKEIFPPKLKKESSFID